MGGYVHYFASRLRAEILWYGFGSTELNASDLLGRGVQYASAECRQLLCDNGIVGSMNCRGNCWDNAVARSSSRVCRRSI